MTLIHRRGLIAAGACAVAGLSTSARAKGTAQAVWTFDNLQTIGGLPVTSVGAPRLIEGPGGRAIAFDGKGDAVFLEEHPLAGAETFTFEAIFRPDGGAFEQRWFHLESEEQPPVAVGKSNTRMLFEIRVVDRGWYLDAFMTGPGYRQAMMAPDKLFPIGRWHHVAQTSTGSCRWRWPRPSRRKALAARRPACVSTGSTISTARFAKRDSRAKRCRPLSLLD